MGFIAVVSRILHSVETPGNAQLPWADAIYFDRGTRMTLLMFDEHVGGLLPEPSRKECDTERMHNWIERTRSDGGKTSIEQNLTDKMGEMKKCSNERDVERVTPRVEFAHDTGLSMQSLGLKYILAKLATKIYDEIMTRESPYDAWYQQLRNKAVLDLALELKVTVDQFAFCLRLGWNPDVIRVEFGFEEQQIVQITKLVSQMNLNELLAFVLAFGQQKFNEGALMLLLDITI